LTVQLSGKNRLQRFL